MATRLAAVIASMLRRLAAVSASRSGIAGSLISAKNLLISNSPPGWKLWPLCGAVAMLAPFLLSPSVLTQAARGPRATVAEQGRVPSTRSRAPCFHSGYGELGRHRRGGRRRFGRRRL